MANTKYKTIAKGTFFSPALNADGPYELLEIREGRTPVGQTVKCVRSGQFFDPAVLSAPTGPQINDQLLASYREVAAWLVANDPGNDLRQRSAVRMLRRAVSQDYVAEDLHQDMTWIATADLGQRVAFLRDHASQDDRQRVVMFIAEVAAGGGAVGETDAEFIERIGTGLGMPSENVVEIMVTAMNRQQHQPPQVA